MTCTATSPSSPYKTPSTSTIFMQLYTYNRVLPTTVTAPRLLQARKILKKILERLKLWISSVLHTQMLVDLYLEGQDASSGSTRSASEDPLMTRHDPITCQSTIINNAVNDRLDLPLLPSELPSNCHVQNDDKYRDGEIPEDVFSDDSGLELVVSENNQIALQYHFSSTPEEADDSSPLLSWPSDISPLTMWHQSAETVESFNYIDNRSEDPNLFVDMQYGSSSVVIDASEPENSDQDTELCVVITPPDDNWGTSAYNNRIGPQYLACLVVPPFYQFTSRLIKYEEWLAICYPPAGTVLHEQSVVTPHRMSAEPLVSSLSRFQKHLQDDRFNCCYVVTALQRHQMKAAVAFTASLKAGLFRMRYDTPRFLENIEPQFKWIDPGEILIESFRHTPQNVTIHTSHRPCSVPHIAIHESPPYDPYVVWSNSTDSYNYCFLTVSPPNPSLWANVDSQMTDDDYLTDASSSLYDSSAPVTPRDFYSTLEQDLDMLFDEDTYEVPQYSAPEPSDRTFLSESKFFIPDDDDEDSLPPLDDWYISIANRCMPPEEAVAVAAAAMTVSCQ